MSSMLKKEGGLNGAPSFFSTNIKLYLVTGLTEIPKLELRLL